MPTSRVFLRLTVAALVLTQPGISRAYQESLDAAGLHEAYVLGQRNDAATAAFRAAYLKEFTTDARDAVRITQIEVLTPFAQVVDRSRRNTAGYTEQQARSDYQAGSKTIAFHVMLLLPAAYQEAKENPGAANSLEASGAREDFWRRFEFRVKQGPSLLPIRSVRSEAIYSSATQIQPAVLDGANVWLEFDVKDVASAETVVEVGTPQGHTISASFDLKKLR